MRKTPQICDAILYEWKFVIIVIANVSNSYNLCNKNPDIIFCTSCITDMGHQTKLTTGCSQSGAGTVELGQTGDEATGIHQLAEDLAGSGRENIHTSHLDIVVRQVWIWVAPNHKQISPRMPTGLQKKQNSKDIVSSLSLYM